MSAHDTETLKFYTKTAETYISSGPNGASRHFEEFERRLPRGSHVLELGCGGGRDAKAFMSAGHRVDATDGTPEIAAQAARLLGTSVRVMRFEDLDTLETYDAVWANASLLHVPRTDLPDILARIYRALKPGGLHLASFKSGGTEGRDQFGRYYNYPSQDQLLDFYAQSAEWDVLTIDAYQGGGYQTTTLGPWLAITARKPV